jgi:hypothetical protein
MNHSRILKILGISLIISLLLIALPATPALAGTITPSPLQGDIGATISITGAGFQPTVTEAQYVLLYFSKQQAAIGQYVGSTGAVTVYATIGQVLANSSGSFTTTFTVPAKLSDNSNVVSGTYYIYACQHSAPDYIVGVTTFTVTGGDITISPVSGTVDTYVDITGSAFTAGQTIVITFDGITVNIEQGNTTTTTAGGFVSTVAVPEGKAGVHTFKATVGSGTAAAEATATFTVVPDIIISPQSGVAGASVDVSGTGFARRTNVSIYFNDILVTSKLSDTNGSFYTTLTIPEGTSLAAGVYNIDAEDTDVNVASIPFTLNVPETPTPTPTETATPTPTGTATPTPTPTEPATIPLNLSSTEDINGTRISIVGVGFTPNAVVTITYDGEAVGTTTAGADGLVIADFYTPPNGYGTHTVIATDGTNTGTATFTVQSAAPSVPMPVSPSVGDKVKSPIGFDWEDAVTDVTPVTYDLQISADKDFSAGSIIFSKTQLSTSEYTLSEMEELDLAARDEPYYWRIRAVDALSVESPWSGANEVYISPPFSFPNWALYTLLGIGAVILFGLGYWLGRRTAFYY